MGLAQPKVRRNHQEQWKTARHVDKMLSKSISNDASMSVSIKLMEKMGWKEGEGLGATKQGMIEPIKSKQTFANRGLGFTREKGIEHVHYASHYEKFESVLAALNDTYSTETSPALLDQSEVKPKKSSAKGSDTEIKPKNLLMNNVKARNSSTKSNPSTSGSDESSSDSSDSSDDSSSDDNTKKTSLEKLSQGSNRRLHYKKFTRGKDTSRYTADDLACILGSKAHVRYNEHVQKKDDSYTVCQIPSNNTDKYISWQASGTYDPSKFNSSNNSTVVNDSEEHSKISASSYTLNKTPQDSDDDEEDCRPSFGKAAGDVENSIDDVVSRPSFGLGCEKRSSNAGEDLISAEETGDNKVQLFLQKRFAAKYMQAFVKDGVTGTLETDDNVDDTNMEFASESKDVATVELNAESNEKKQKKNSKVIDDSQNVDEIQLCEINKDVTQSVRKVSKKNKKRKAVSEPEESSVVSEFTEEPEDNKSVKKSKKKRKLTTNINEKITNSELEKEEPMIVADSNKSTEESTKKKNKKKIKSCAEDIEMVTNSELKMDESIIVIDNSKPTEELHKKKNKKKSKRCADNIEIIDIEQESKNTEKKRKLNLLNDSCIIVDEVQINEEEVGRTLEEPPKKKGKKNKTNQSGAPDDDICVIDFAVTVPASVGSSDAANVTPSSDDTDPLKKTKKKKKKSKKVTEKNIDSDENNEVKEVVAKKIKRKRPLDTDGRSDEISSDGERISKKEKKRKKKHHCKD